MLPKTANSTMMVRPWENMIRAWELTAIGAPQVLTTKPWMTPMTTPANMPTSTPIQAFLNQ